MANRIQTESTAKERAAALDELNKVINPDHEGGCVISGMTKRSGFNRGYQADVQGLPKDSRRKGRL